MELSHNIRKPTCLTALVSVALGLVIATSGATGCRGKQPTPDASDESANAAPGFQWDTERRVPRWRENSPIQWYETFQQEEVIQESLSSGKPILCYISRDDWGYKRRAIEIELLSADGWDELIAENFVAWNIDFWEDAVLALGIVAAAARSLARLWQTPPSLVVLRPAESDNHDGFMVIDQWDEYDFYSFPGTGANGPISSGETHQMMWTAGDEQVQRELERLEEDQGRVLAIDRRESHPGGEYAAFADRSQITGEQMGEGYIGPDYCLWLSYVELAAGEEIRELDTEVSAWSVRNEPTASSLPFDTTLLRGLERYLASHVFERDDYYVPSNLSAEMCAAANDIDYPLSPDLLFGELYRMVASDDCELQGGFPAYLDLYEAAEEYFASFPDASRATPPVNPLETRLGPRDIPWVNANALSMWVELVAVDPALKRVPLPDGQKTGDFLLELAPAMLLALENRISAESARGMLVIDRIHLLRLFNILYQTTGDVSLLQKAGVIAAAFPHDAPAQWFEPGAGLMYPELAIGLYHYGCLAEDEDARASARLIPDEVTRYSYLYGISIEEIRLLMAYKVVHAKCIRVSILASLDDQSGRRLLEAALEGWDPRKVAQLLNPARDAELIQRKGLEPADEPVAYVSVSEMTYPPVTGPDELRALIKRVQADLVEGNSEHTAGN